LHCTLKDSKRSVFYLTIRTPVRAMPHYVNIALPLPALRLFTYTIPEVMQQDHLLGVRAIVPFGKRVLTGVIVEDNAQPSKDALKGIKPVTELLDSEPAFTPPMLAFTHWVAEYYCASWGETLKAALPQGMTVESVVRVSAVRVASEDELAAMERRAPRRAALLRELMNHTGDVSVGYLENVVGGSGSVAAQVEALEQLGYVERHRQLSKEIKPKLQKAVRVAPALALDEEAMRLYLNQLDKTSPKQAVLLSHIWIYERQSGQQIEQMQQALQTQPAQQAAKPLLAKDALAATHTAASTLAALVQKSYVEEYQAEILRTEAASPEEAQTLIQRDETNLALTLEQAHATEKILEPLRASTFKTFLLHGVTGSGKTLVYIQILRETLALGKSALLLVPEIALTPQLIERFRAVFGDAIGVMHSHKSAGERYDAWRMARSGHARVIIGARSAVFAPLQNLGLIIVDEEHEPSYKQDDPAPRYNARDVAVVRGAMEQAVVVLGSATPSLESVFNAHSGKYHLLEIKHRADGAQLPTIRVIDTIEARKRKRLNGSFSHELVAAIAQRVRKGEGVILFQNRRGFASRLECLDCGTVPECPNCSVALTYHKHRDQLRCHYCGYSRKADTACTACGSLAVREVGFGTQRIEEELQPLLEQALNEPELPSNEPPSNQATRLPVIQRMDLDTTSAKGSHKRMLTDFASGKIDILVGTQMVAKGLDFARVTLVGVINADMQMYLPDFRAAERTFQLLTQVAGRAGRSSELRGEVILQTAHPRHQTILAAVAGSYELFYNDELQFRKDAVYPPFSRFVMIEFSGREEAVVNEQAQYFAHYIPAHHKAFVRLGPTVPTIARLRSLYRRIIVLKGLKDADPSGKILRDAVHAAHAAYNAKHPSSAVHVRIDIDAAGFL
jgi:primosomal protein N' (replication factor Y)